MFELLENNDMQGLVNYLVLRVAIILVCWAFVFISSFVDFCSGRSTARALGEHINSKGYRKTFTKIGDYYRVLIFAFLFDIIGSLFSWYQLPFASMVGSVSVIFIEMRSVIENSRRKKSHAADVPEIVKQIVQCTTSDKGIELLEKIEELVKCKKDSEHDITN